MLFRRAPAAHAVRGAGAATIALNARRVGARAPDPRSSWAAHGDNKQPDSAIDSWDRGTRRSGSGRAWLAADHGESLMRVVIARRALAAAAAITLLTIPSAFAESVASDFDVVTAGSQDVLDLGTVQPGADVPVNV